MSRVVILTLFYHPDRPSGADRLAYDEAVYLAGQRHEVWMVVQGDQPEHTERDGLHVLHYPSPQVSAFSPQRLTIHQEKVRDLLMRYVPDGVDLVHGHTPLAYDGALAVYDTDTRFCYSVHSPVKLEMQAESRESSLAKRMKLGITAQLTHRVERRCLKASHVITSDSAFTREALGELHGTHIREKTQVVPGWVDFDRFQIAPDRDALKARFGWAMDVPVLFTLRRLVPRNGVDRLVRALRQVRDSGAMFQMIIGSSGPMRESLEALTRELGLDDVVRFIGRVDDADLPLMYAAASAFVLPTTELECFGLITLESFAAGRPVLATPVGAIPEIMTQIEPRWLAQSASVEDIADLLTAYLRDELPVHSPDALRDFARSQYSAERVIPALVQMAWGR